MRERNVGYSADPGVAARHVTGRLLDLSHISLRACVADLLADHRRLVPYQSRADLDWGHTVGHGIGLVAELP
jgi:hypothetical protein